MTDKTKRSEGLSAVAILSALSGIFFVLASLRTVVNNYQVLGITPENSWYQFGLVAELSLNIVLFVVGILQITVAYFLWTAKRHAQKFAVLIALLLIFVSLALAAVILSAPAELAISSFSYWFYFAVGAIWFIIYWQYLKKPKTAAYLASSAAATHTTSNATYPVAQTVNLQNVVVRQGKFFCRYCGTENPKDAVFCESCGKQLR